MSDQSEQNHSSLIGIEAESEIACDTRNGRATLLDVRSRLDHVYSFLASPDLTVIDRQDALREIYEQVVCCTVVKTVDDEMDNLLRGVCASSLRPLHVPFVMDALEAFHELAVDPMADEMVSLYALGYAVALGRNPTLLAMGEEADSCVGMMLETVQECRENGRRPIRQKADRAANALAYEEGMASFLGAQFIKSTELICARIISQDQTHDGHRVTAFENWLEKTRDRKGREYLLLEMRGEFEQLDTHVEIEKNRALYGPVEPNRCIHDQRKLLGECLRRGYAILALDS
jgi:hypothetical protein